MQYGPDKVPVSNVSIIVGPPTRGPEPVPVTTTDVLTEPPLYEPVTTIPSSSGNAIVPPPPDYSVAVSYANVIETNKVFTLNFDGAGVTVQSSGDGLATIIIPGGSGATYVVGGSGINVDTTNNISTVTNTGILAVSAGNGISTVTSGGTATVTNTGVLNAIAGRGISTSPSNGNVTITNTGVINTFAGNGIYTSTTNGNVTVTNTGILNVVAGNSISVSTTNGNATVTNTFTETVYNGGNWSGTVTPNRNNGTIQKYTLTGSINLNTPLNISAGQSLTLILTQDGTGGRILNPNAAYKFAGAFNTLSLGPGAIDMLNMFYDGTNYYVTLTVGYA